MSNVTVIVGLQWGNEGKGRIAHHVSRDCIAIRATGSSSAATSRACPAAWKASCN